MTIETFDIIVVGGGIAGASIGAELAATHHVAVLEKEEFAGYHSTGRSAALYSTIYGNAPVRALTRASREFLFHPPSDFTTDSLVKPRGMLHIARQDQRGALAAFAGNADLLGSIRPVSGREALALCPVLRPDQVHSGVLEPNAADLNVNALHQGYLRKLRRAGGTLVTGAEVRSARVGGETKWRVTTQHQVFEAPLLIDAAGPWATRIAQIAGAQPIEVQPRRRTALVAELPAGIAADCWPLVIDIAESFYFKPDAGLLFVSPADETPTEPCDVQPEELDVAIAVDRLEAATTLEIRRIRKKWAGLRSFAPDRSPLIGFDSLLPSFFWFAGQGGYGIQMAPAAAKLGAALVRGDAPKHVNGVSVEDFSPVRFRA